MKALARFADIHTHRRRGPDCITNLEAGQSIDTAPGEAYYSAGIHPWDTGSPVPDYLWQWLEHIAADQRVVAIGECGLDALSGGPSEVQTEVFIRQARLAERVEKPLIIHAVRSWPQIMALRRRLCPRQTWIIHGFRGKPELARQLLAAGFDISKGTRYNPAALAVIPPDRLHRETDTAE